METSDSAAEHTRRAGRSVRKIVERQLSDTDVVDVLADFDDDATDQRREALVSAISTCARDDPDFARRLLVAINSDVVADSAPTEAPAAAALALHPVVRLILGVAMIIVGILMRDHYHPQATFCGYGFGGSDDECATASILATASLFVIGGGALIGGEAVWRLAKGPRR